MSEFLNIDEYLDVLSRLGRSFGRYYEEQHGYYPSTFPWEMRLHAWHERYQNWLNKPKKLTFKDLEDGDLFIGFPVDGDNSGHGGYLSTHNIFRKDMTIPDLNDGFSPTKNAICLSSNTFSSMPDSMEVLKVSM